MIARLETSLLTVMVEGVASLTRTPQRGYLERRFGASGCTVHRADLLDVLAAVVPAESVKLGARCVSVQVDEHGASARFADGTEIEADVIVGADGIHSAVRGSLIGPDAPRFTGKVCWRCSCLWTRWRAAFRQTTRSGLGHTVQSWCTGCAVVSW